MERDADPACLIEISPDDAIPLTTAGSNTSMVRPMPNGASRAGASTFLHAAQLDAAQLDAAQFDFGGLSLRAKASAILGN